MMSGRQEGNKTETEEAGREIKCRAVNVMYRHRHRSHSVLFIPPSKKSKQYVMCPLLFPVTRCTKIHTVKANKKKLHEMTT